MADTVDPAPRLSVIVPVRNGADTLAGQLEALAAEVWDQPWEVVIVDNDSDDDTPAIAERYVANDARFRVVAARKRHNLSYVRNVGVAAACADAVAFCDDDDQIAEGWVAAMGTALAEHPLVGSRLEYERLNDPHSSVGRARFQDSGISRFFGMPNLAGAGHGCQRWLFESLAGNDEYWDRSGEDFDFSFRAFLQYEIEPYFAEEAVYHYRRRDDPRSAFRQARNYGRSHAALYKRYGRPRGARPEPLRSALRTDLWLLLHAHHLLDADRRLAWAWKAGIRLGRLEGSIRHRTLFL